MSAGRSRVRDRRELRGEQLDNSLRMAVRIICEPPVRCRVVSRCTEQNRRGGWALPINGGSGRLARSWRSEGPCEISRHWARAGLRPRNSGQVVLAALSLKRADVRRCVERQAALVGEQQLVRAGVIHPGTVVKSRAVGI